MQEVKTGMTEKGITTWNGSTGKRGQKDKSLGTERCQNIDTLHINNNNNYYYYYYHYSRTLRQEL